jgi:hypothetical protein
MGTFSRRMPPEIIREIFSHVFSSPLKIGHASQFPWYLGQICSQWRTLFFSMQSVFWRKIEINHLPYCCVSERVDAIITFSLNRTRVEPFSFTVSLCSRSLRICGNRTTCSMDSSSSSRTFKAMGSGNHSIKVARDEAPSCCQGSPTALKKTALNRAR